MAIMQWTDDGIVLGVKRHGETSGGFSSRLKPVLQLGNSLSATWRARLDEHLGNYAVEGLHLRASNFFASSHAVYGVSHLAALMRLLPERDPHGALYDALDAILDRLDDAGAAAPMVARFELRLLAELGFGLDLTQCAATGASDDLIYVSPKSGRAVSRAAGEPWADKMLRLPAFLREADAVPSLRDLADGFALTGFFLSRHALEPRGLKLADERAHFIAALERALPSVA